MQNSSPLSSLPIYEEFPALFVLHHIFLQNDFSWHKIEIRQTKNPFFEGASDVYVLTHYGLHICLIAYVVNLKLINLFTDITAEKHFQRDQWERVL